MSKSSKSSKEYSREEKLAILKEAAENGVKATLEKHSLLPGTYYYWKKRLCCMNMISRHSDSNGLNH